MARNTIDRGRPGSIYHLFGRKTGLDSGRKQKIIPGEPMEPTRLPHYAMLPYSFELAAGLRRRLVGRWLAIGFDVTIIDAKIAFEAEREMEEQGRTISIDEAVHNLQSENELAGARLKRRLSEIEKKYNKEIQAYIKEFSSSMDGPELEFVDPSNPYRVIDCSCNQGLDAAVFDAFIKHPMMVEAIEDTFEDPSEVMDGLVSGYYALMCDRRSRVMHVAYFDDACCLAETSTALSGRSYPEHRVDEIMAPCIDVVGEDCVNSAMTDAFLRIMHEEMNAFLKRKAEQEDERPRNRFNVVNIKDLRRR